LRVPLLDPGRLPDRGHGPHPGPGPLDPPEQQVALDLVTQLLQLPELLNYCYPPSVTLSLDSRLPDRPVIVPVRVSLYMPDLGRLACAMEEFWEKLAQAA
jgi:hypothetical protein